VLDTQVAHREVVGVVGQQDGAMCSRRSGDERVRGVDRLSPLGTLALVAAGATSGLSIGDEEPEPVEERLRALPLALPQATVASVWPSASKRHQTDATGRISRR
jgi:hypothetical protein